MTQSASATTAPTNDAAPSGESVTETLDRLSLEQALVDVEVANARVIDLTARLTESHAEAQQLRQQVAELAAVAPVATGSGLRIMIVGPAKAVARLVLPLSVRTRIRGALG